MKTFEEYITLREGKTTYVRLTKDDLDDKWVFTRVFVNVDTHEIEKEEELLRTDNKKDAQQFNRRFMKKYGKVVPKPAGVLNWLEEDKDEKPKPKPKDAGGTDTYDHPLSDRNPKMGLNQLKK